MAQGQKPSWSDVQTNSMKGWLGWDAKRSSNRSTRIRAIILNKWGLSRIVHIASRFENSCGGGRGNGSSYRVQETVGLRKGAISTSVHTDLSKYLGRLSMISRLSALLSSMSRFAAFIADVQPSAVLLRLVAFVVVPVIARLILFPFLAFFTLSTALFFRRSGYD